MILLTGNPCCKWGGNYRGFNLASSLRLNEMQHSDVWNHLCRRDFLYFKILGKNKRGLRHEQDEFASSFSSTSNECKKVVLRDPFKRFPKMEKKPFFNRSYRKDFFPRCGRSQESDWNGFIVIICPTKVLHSNPETTFVKVWSHQFSVFSEKNCKTLKVQKHFESKG